MEPLTVICRKCGAVYVDVKILRPNEVLEARKRRLPVYPVTCQRCGSHDVEVRREKSPPSTLQLQL